MWLRRIVAALRKLPIWFGFGATNTPSPVCSTATDPLCEPKPPKDKAGTASEQKPAHDSALGCPVHRDGATEAHPNGGRLDNDQERGQPETGRHSEVDEPEGKGGDSSRATKPQKSELKPYRIGGKRAPQSLSPTPEQRLQSPPSRPDLTCRRVPASPNWEVILNADRTCRLAEVFLNGAPLDHNTQECCIPTIAGRLFVSCQEGQEYEIPLFENIPLIFKLRKDWAGQGRKIARITSGYFIVIAPVSWERTGRVPVEPDGCADDAFRAHYFHRDITATNNGQDGFLEWKDPLVATGIELIGQCVLDDSDEGDLFVGDALDLNCSPGVAWARVGEETERGWGQNFRPDKQSLSEVLDDREGRFFLRIYDSGMSMLDSIGFRRLRNLKRILINESDYTQSTVLVPTSMGYPPTKIRFIGADDSILSPKLPDGVLQRAAPLGVIEVPRKPDADRITCRLGSNASGVNIVLNLPRIWWRFERELSDLGEWRDTPLVMTRDEFREYAYANSKILLLSRGFKRIFVGFDDELDRPYNCMAGDDCIAIPLDHFVDYKQIERRPNCDAYFNVEWAGKVVRLIQISADTLPEIVSFVANPATIDAGQEVILNWATRYVGDARVEIDPGVGVVKSSGTLRIEPAASLQFTLRIKSPDTGDVTKNVAVTVQANEQTQGLMTSVQLLEKIVGMKTGVRFEYYRGHLGLDTSNEANRLRSATQYWEKEEALKLVQGKIAEGTFTYFAIRTSVPITEDSIEKARILQVRKVS